MNSNQHTTRPLRSDEANSRSEVLKSKQPVLVAFWAPWSRPCQILDSVLDEVATRMRGKVKVVKVNADDNPDLEPVV